MDSSKNTLLAHLEALRRMLLACFITTALFYPFSFLVTPHAITALVKWSFPSSIGKLHYFNPMEVFWVQLQLALVIALVAAYPFNLLQIWKFLLPALYKNERNALRLWLIFSTVLFFAGAAFCVYLILPLLMNFSGGFATAELQPVFGLATFLNLAGWLILTFAMMFQTPILVLLAVRFHLLTSTTLRKKRPYIFITILTIAGIMTPPDIVSQIMLAIPTWLLFELGLFAATRMEKQQAALAAQTVCTSQPEL